MRITHVRFETEDDELQTVRQRALQTSGTVPQLNAPGNDKREKGVFLKDLHREAVLSGAVLRDEEEDEATTLGNREMTHVEEQEQLKKELKVIIISI